MPLRRSALSVSPCGDAWGTPLDLETGYSWAPIKPPEGTNTKVTSAKGPFCAYPSFSGLGQGACDTFPVAVPMRGSPRRKELLWKLDKRPQALAKRTE